MDEKQIQSTRRSQRKDGEPLKRAKGVHEITNRS
jgi:hypothetical protein